MKKFSLGIALALAVLTSCSKDDPAPVKSSSKDITAFSIDGTAFTIDGTTITGTMPLGANIKELKATFTASSLATVKIGETVQESGVTVNNFSTPLVYKVTAEDGSTKEYTVTATETVILPKKTTSVDHSQSPATTTISTFTYNGRKIVNSVSEDGSKVNYTYNADNTIKSVEMFNASGVSTSKAVYEYNSNGELIKRTDDLMVVQYSKEADGRIKVAAVITSNGYSLTNYWTFTNGNRTKSESSSTMGTGEFASTTVTTEIYTYDKNPNPQYEITGFDKLYNYSKNNCTESTNTTVTTSTTVYTNVTKYRYAITLHENGYPKEIKSYSTPNEGVEALTKTDTYAY